MADQGRFVVTFASGATFEGLFPWPSIPAMLMDAGVQAQGGYARAVDLHGTIQYVNIARAATIEEAT